ncbi:MAG TPA: hypothetical protein DCW43_01620 [Clostridiales bacterium]|nr:hypothetical protein [Clostridiales bacterium]
MENIMDDSKKSNRKNILILAGVLIAALGLLVFMAFAFFGLGEKLKYMSYTKISCTEDLQKLKEDPDGKFLLTSDIDMNGMEWKPFSFSGILDGHGYTIFGLTVTSTGEARRDTYDGNLKSYSTALAGMFDSLDQAQVRDLTFRDSHVDITSDEPCFVGTLAGYMSDSKITNVNVIGDVYLRAHDRMFGVGGVVGYGYGSFTGVQTDVTLVCIDTDRTTKDEQFMGGICGAGYPDIVNCTIDIDGYVSEHGYTHNGGMIGLYMFSPEGMTYKGKMTGNSVYGKITFFEENDDRRAYCKGMIGEYLDELEVFENNGESFRAIEVKNYDADLLPEKELQSFEVEADKAGEYDVSISYSNPGEDATYGLFINDRFIKKAFFPKGEGTITETVHLDAGKAQVVFKYIPGDGNITVSSVFAVKSEKKVTLIVAPHEDDEILAFAGTIQKTIAEGNIVKVLFLTNGDYFGSDLTPVRYEESVRALELLGVDKSDITFLGYGDLTLGTILQSDNWDGMFRAHSGYYQTYGVPEQNLFDYRFLRSGSYAYYNRRDLTEDMHEYILANLPDRIFTTSEYEWHEDHKYAFLLVKSTIETIVKETEYHPVLCESVIHGEETTWPEYLTYNADGSAVITEFSTPFPTMQTTLDWNKVTKIILTDEEVKKKMQAIAEFKSQNDGGEEYASTKDYNYAFCKRDEFYWECPY